VIVVVEHLGFAIQPERFSHWPECFASHYAFKCFI